MAFTPWFTGLASDWNSYATVAQADLFLTDLSGRWGALTNAQKEAYLIGATEWLDNRYGKRYLGCEPCECDQRTCLPRTKMYIDCDSRERACDDPTDWLDVTELTASIAYSFAAGVPVPFPPLSLSGVIVSAENESRVGGRRSCDNWEWYKSSLQSRVGEEYLRTVENRLCNIGMIRPIAAEKWIRRRCDVDQFHVSGVSWNLVP